MTIGNEHTTLLDCSNITVRFGGLVALSDLNLTVNRGEVLGIAGPNGAGKTTLFNVISGHVRPSKGSVHFSGMSLVHLRPDQIFQLGIARTFQIPELIGTQSVYHNILVGAHFARDDSVRTALLFAKESYCRAKLALSDYGLDKQCQKLACNTSLYERKMIMLASAAAHVPQLLLLDEPVGGLSPGEADAILEHVQKIREKGTTVVVIEHIMRVLMTISDRLVILNRGSVLFDGKPEEARANPDVQRLYLGARNTVNEHKQ